MWICAGVYLLLLMSAILFKKKLLLRNKFRIANKMLPIEEKKTVYQPYEELGRRIWVLMFLVTTLAMLLEAAELGSGGDFGEMQIERNGYGEGQKKETLQMQVEDEEPEEVEIEVSPREYSQEELNEQWQCAMDRLEEVILGDNESADYVVKDLYLPDKLDEFPFTITWEFDRYDVIDMMGRLNQQAIEEADPESEGIMVTVTGILRYEEKEAVYSRELLIFSEEKEEKGISDRVLEIVSQLDEESREEQYISLPQSVDGKSVKWKKKSSAKSVPLLILGGIGSVLLICLEKQRREQERKDKNAQMLLDYPEIVSQFTMLMGAGMTAKNVWKKVAEDYRKQKKSTGRERAAYEEILYTYQEMQSGIPETECYERFAKRCELVPYMKMGALLAQNLKKGAKGISEMLRMEAIQAMEERKSRARRLGEEAGTKLLVPMLLMLIIVLMIVVIPAFLSIQI